MVLRQLPCFEDTPYYYLVGTRVPLYEALRRIMGLYQVNMSHSLNSLDEVSVGDYIWE